MKRCPQCNRVETDEALKFCRVDGVTLVDNSSPVGNEAGTAQLGSKYASEVHTSILPNQSDTNIDRATGPTTVFATQPTASSTLELNKPKRRKTAIIITIIVTAGFLTRAAGASIKPGVEQSGTPGPHRIEMT